MRRLMVTTLIIFVGCLLVSTSASQAQPQAICVDWRPDDPDIAHASYSGAQTRLKGIARGGATEYRWEFGDGSPGTPWASISNPYNLEVSHTYTGFAGQIFVATLYVRDGVDGEDLDTYRLRLLESSDLSNPEHLDIRINMAVDEGLWWLHTHMNRGTYDGASPGYGQPYGYWSDPGGYPLPASCTAVDAFQLHGYKANGNYHGDPYVETVQRGLNYMLYNTYAFNIGMQDHGDPDYDHPVDGKNGIGLVMNQSASASDTRQTYIGGICMNALASSTLRNRTADVGRDYVKNRTYAEIVQDMVDFFAWGQVDSGSGRGGWRYYANYNGSDMSTTQWPPLAMIAAEDDQNMDSVVPQFVRDELPYFLNQTYYTSCNSNHGGHGYSYQSNYLNVTKAAAGLICRDFLSTPLDDPLFQGSLGFLYRHWNDTGGEWTYQRVFGNSYVMYGVMKAMRDPEPDIYRINNYDCISGEQTDDDFDWYYTPAGQANMGLATYIVADQHADGSWDDSTGPNRVYDAFATGWRVLTLLEGVTILPPEAEICDCDNQIYNLNQDIELNGSCSFHPDPNRSIVSCEWDFDYDGTFVTDYGGGPEDCKATIPGGYPDVDLYPQALRVTDDRPGNPQSDIFVCVVDVHEPPHCPHAFAHLAPEGQYDGFIGVPLILDASRSWDPDNEIVSWDWDVDNDGLYGAEDNDAFGEPSDAVGETTQWTWDAPYNGTIGLRVIDAEGEFPPCDKYDSVVVDIGNHEPVSDPDGPYTACQNCTITLNGSRSYDIDPGDTITYAWDLDNDGDYEDDGCFEVTCEFQAGPTVGTLHDICLKVTDSFGEIDIGCTTVEVDVLMASPRSTGFWAHQCSDLGFQQVSQQDLDQLFLETTEVSNAFDECAPIGCEILQFSGRQNEMAPKAQRQLLALWLNVVSDRLSLNTPIDLGALTSATIVAEAITEVESVVCNGNASRADLETAKDIAEALNLRGEDMALVSQLSSQTVMVGGQGTFTLGLINMSPYTRNYDLTANGNWPVRLSHAGVNGLRSGQIALISVEVTVPLSVSIGEAEEISVMATDQHSDGTLQREVMLTISAGRSGSGGLQPGRKRMSPKKQL